MHEVVRDDGRVRVLAPGAAALDALTSLRPGLGFLDRLDVRRSVLLATGPGVFRPPVAADGGRTSTGAWPLSTDDLDGDGGDDVTAFAWHVRYDEDFEVVERRYRVVARSGSDASLLWRTPEFGSASDLWLADLDGDGADDLLVFDRGGRPDFFGPDVSAGTMHVEQILQAYSGRDGSPMWRRVEPGMYRWAASGIEWVRVVEARNIVMDVEIGVAGAGADVVVSTADYVEGRNATTYSNLHPRGFSVGVTRCSTNAIFVAGATGAGRPGPVAADRDACGSFTPIGDRSGDGEADLALYTERELELWSRAGEVHWSRDLPGDDSLSWIDPVPLAGPGRPDILLSAYNVYFESGDGWISLTIKRDHAAGFDGATGSTLFDRHFEWFFMHAGIVDEDGGLDLYDVGLTDGFDWSSFAAVDGATGEGLWGPREIPRGEGRFPSVNALGDVDGSGSLDVLVSTWSFDGRTFRSVDLEMWNGGNGATMWALPAVTDHATIPWGIYSEAGGGDDANADGRADLVTYRRGSGSWTAAVVDGLTLGPLSSFSVPDVDHWFDWGYFDLAPAPGEEVLVFRHGGIEDSYQRPEAHSTAGPLWSFPPTEF